LNNPLQYNFTIVGAGASGLWLAHSLFTHGLLANNTLCIVESDAHKTNDRTWCYWATEPIEPIEMISKEWESIYQSNISSHPKKLAPYKYYHIRSQDFYSSIKDRLVKCQNIFWRTEEVVEINDLDSQVETKTKTQSWLSHRVFLSALPTSAGINIDYKLLQQRFLKNITVSKHNLFLWQSFVGWRVKTVEKVFDESNMSMMDFNVAQDNYTQFMYELPFSPTEALVEMTRFGKDKLSVLDAEKALKKYMEEKGSPYQITEVETGAIPMTPQFDMHRRAIAKEERIIYIGTLGGAIKATTGFGFKRMHHYAEALAVSLKGNRTLPSMHRPYRFRLYDILLLQILQSQPHHGKKIFEQLFRAQPIQRILKFLDEKTTFAEEVFIFSKLPIGLFLKSLFHYFVAR
jgi:lycopene beta-cyclase